MDAIQDYVANPLSFDPSRGRTLQGFLQFAAERNLLNTLRSEGRRRGHHTRAAARAAKKSVELPTPPGNLIEKEAAARIDRNHEQAIALLTHPIDRKVCALRQAGERKTAAFAAILGLAHLPAADGARGAMARRAMDDAMLERLSRRTAARPEFWAWVFERYEHWGGPAVPLAKHLHLTPRDFQRLGLYLRPRPDHFDEDLRNTATDFGVDRAALAAIVRFVDALSAMPGPSQTAPNQATPETGFLAAARERKPRPPGGP